jgi:hypothetical protein
MFIFLSRESKDIDLLVITFELHLEAYLDMQDKLDILNSYATTFVAYLFLN